MEEQMPKEAEGEPVGDGGEGPLDPATKNYNSSKSNTSEISVEDDLVGDGGGGGEDPMTKNYNSSKSNTSSVKGEGVDGPTEPDSLTPNEKKTKGRCHHCGSLEHSTSQCKIKEVGEPNEQSGSPDDLVGDGGGPGEPAMIKNYNSSKSNTSSISVEDDLVGDGGGGPADPAQTKYQQQPDVAHIESGSWSQNSVGPSGGDGGGGNGGKAGGGGSEKSGSAGRGERRKEMRKKFDKGSAGPDHDHNDIGGATRISNQGRSSSGAGPSDPARGTNHNSTKSNTTSVKKGPGIVRKGVGKTLSLAKTVIMTAVLISVAGAGVDVYQTYNDAIAIDLEERITDADFELSDDKSEISGTVGFDIPEMGMFEKSIIASVHVTVLESNPTTEDDYEFEYTLGSGEQFYAFTLDDLDPVTVEKIEAGEPLDIEYSGKISVTYLGVEIPSVTMDIPLTTTTVETA